MSQLGTGSIWGGAQRRAWLGALVSRTSAGPRIFQKEWMPDVEHFDLAPTCSSPPTQPVLGDPTGPVSAGPLRSPRFGHSTGLRRCGHGAGRGPRAPWPPRPSR